VRFKTDENVPTEVAELLVQHGHDAVTVMTQRLAGATDPVIARICQAERRALVTLDLDFADIRRYPRDEYSGIVVLRPKSRMIPAILRLTLKLVRLMEGASPTGQLWIVDESHVRIRGRNAT